MLKSSRKKLIAIGCSFTEHYLRLDHDFPRWPQHLADMLDMECVNLGNCGSGNDQILAKALDVSLNEKDIGLVVLMWSEWQRIGFQMYLGFEPANWNRWYHSTPHDTEDWKEKLFEKQNPLHATRTAFRTFVYAEKLLRNLPYLFIQGTIALVYESDIELKKRVDYKRQHGRRSAVPGMMDKIDEGILHTTKEIISSPYLDYIEKNIGDKFIGWPIVSELGGYCVEDILDKKDPFRKKLRISVEDSHPNGEGHKIISEEIYNAYAKIYI